uniref:Uncharacterized protein n=1 Tax=Coccolithus braarudii TaxID=221442 RepID=A0A7S0Q399_9EUKA|mmetsp:Transcript_29036/g.62465  ORF Transcript_29036/g.62465 Transcript_29036/m.62465 type:complete len:146 (+) Transcript_29036:306-743(+)
MGRTGNLGIGCHRRKAKQKLGTCDKKFAINRDKRIADATTAEREAAAEMLAGLASSPALLRSIPATSTRPSGDQQERRRQAIVWKFEELGSPASELWHGSDGTIAKIRKWLDLPWHANLKSIEQVLQRHCEGVALTAFSKCGGKP